MLKGVSCPFYSFSIHSPGGHHFSQVWVDLSCFFLKNRVLCALDTKDGTLHVIFRTLLEKHIL